ncbi:LysR family transcriptional regulator [Alicyclobacillus sp. SO9]|uniref:LysR family transcriptional regulator n=1 Tax=Alicyclobacillus sp. SO9 TaxID=2665646 RepID=UPI0018E8F16E|nr:LysR substrate-binding domain-containing protein [Alicyclobacillus sp. SO9]QQE78182.1 LysR family transcriptional regulator [Alicyclobacillus sp. SO9]
MELRLLEYFMMVCEELHFTRAAERLGISQPTLSHQIRVLESRLNTQLFHRIGKKVYLSQSGKILFEHTKLVFYELTQATSEIKELQGLLRGTLAIGCAGSHLLTSAAMSFHSRHPDIELSILDLTSKETIAGLLSNKLDIGVIFKAFIGQHFEFVPLFNEELLLVVDRHHPLANTQQIELKDLQRIPLSLLPTKYLIRQFVDKYCHDAGFELHPKMELSSLESLHQIVSLKTTATILTKSYLATTQDPTISSISIENPTPQQSIGVVYRKNSFLDKGMHAFVTHLIQYYTENKSAMQSNHSISPSIKNHRQHL